MNWLVYKGGYQEHTSNVSLDHTNASQMLMARLNLTEDELNMDDIMAASRLKKKNEAKSTNQMQKSSRSSLRGNKSVMNSARFNQTATTSTSKRGLKKSNSSSTGCNNDLSMMSTYSYAEWCKQKDAERRLKRKLISQA